MKGVIPAAGLGTRLLPATRAQPKEMLPIVDKPTIQYVVEEAAASGLSEVIIVIGPTKGSIRDHFDADPASFEPLERAGKLREIEPLLDLVRRIPIRFVAQKEPRGLADAVYQARHAIGNEPFAVLLGDDIILSKRPAALQLLDEVSPERRTIIGVQPLPPQDLVRYGVVDAESGPGKARRVKDLVEKPEAGKAPSNLAIIGRYILSPAIFEAIKQITPGRGGELQLTDAIQRLRQKEPVFALEIEGERLDVGGKLDWLAANLRVALEDPALGPHVRELLKRFR